MCCEEWLEDVWVFRKADENKINIYTSEVTNGCFRQANVFRQTECYLLYNESNSKLITFGARTLANQNESINEPAYMIHIKVL